VSVIHKQFAFHFNQDAHKVISIDILQRRISAFIILITDEFLRRTWPKVCILLLALPLRGVCI